MAGSWGRWPRSSVTPSASACTTSRSWATTTSGTFEADYPGRLSSSKRVGVTAVEYGLSRG